MPKEETAIVPAGIKWNNYKKSKTVEDLKPAFQGSTLRVISDIWFENGQWYFMQIDWTGVKLYFESRMLVVGYIVTDINNPVVPDAVATSFEQKAIDAFNQFVEQSRFHQDRINKTKGW